MLKPSGDVEKGKRGEKTLFLAQFKTILFKIAKLGIDLGGG